ncbi:GAF domain-containing protein [Nonomuraea sp. NN258]|uniref:helix-turn-helix domain-containing protein n=1 Tax=Nonomuraea antri TaxID=2730852 RepID=UPI001568B422|nr:helix-turn-helix domain-containing protein [Nonomuraea antri]NRQ30354.1 GAF domain-containing protein [Nonomuraea antri]
MSYPHLDAYSRLLRGAHEAAVTGEVWPASPRGLISASWRRSLAAGIDPDGGGAPLAWDPSRIAGIRDAHPLRPLLPLLVQTLTAMADESAHVMIVTDGDGRVLWRDGNHAVMRRADQVGLADGHQWAEDSVGTNGIGTALATGRPVHVYSEEHLMRVLHVWSCSAAPITDPDSGQVIGCVDVSGTARSLHPATVALVGATAKLAETQLAVRMHERDDRLRRRFEALHTRAVLLSPTGRVIAGDPAGQLGERVPLPGAGRRMILRDGRVAQLEPFSDGYLVRPAPTAAPPTLTLSLLGDGPHTARLDDRELPLSLRHAEILALLALHPKGLTAEQLSYLLYGDDGNPVTIRAEIHRLRAQLGDTVAAKPYHLTCPVEADFLALPRLLAADDAATLARAYPGPLLPRSESPEIRRERDELEAQVRARLLRDGAADDLWTYAQTSGGRDDFQILERLAALTADPRSAAARSRLSS